MSCSFLSKCCRSSRFPPETERTDQEGLANGVAWTEAGGDTIVIDAVNNLLDLKITKKEMAARRKAYIPRPLLVTSGALYKYAKMVSTASEGCVTDNF